MPDIHGSYPGQWFARLACNWRLQDFEMQKNPEHYERIHAHCQNPSLMVTILMIHPSMDQRDKAKEGPPYFRSAIIHLLVGLLEFAGNQ
jgi:hypothetical protein